MINANQQPYPAYSLSPLLFQAGNDVGAKLKCAYELIPQQMQSVVSAAVQSRIQVDVPVFGISPTSLWMLTVAESAEGKDAVRKLVDAGFNRFAHAVADRDRLESKNNAATMSVWRAERDGLQNKLRRLVGRGEDVEEIKLLLNQHYSSTPISSIPHSLLLENFDAKGLVINLATASKFVFINSTEGSSVLNRNFINNLPLLVKTFSGEPISYTFGRPNFKSYAVDGALTTMSLMVQPKSLADFLHGKKDTLISSGALPRFLPAYPLPQRGHRLINDSQTNMNGLDEFNSRVFDILSESPYFNNRSEEKITMVFSPQARTHWVNVSNEIESSMAPGGGLFAVPEFAGRLANNVARMAANWQYFQHGNAEISASTLSAAVEVCKWHANEFVRMFSEEAQLMGPELDASALEEFLRSWYQRRGVSFWTFANLSRYVCRRLRSKIKLENALMFLVTQGKVFRTKDDSGDFINLNLYYFGQPVFNSQMPLLQLS